MSTVVKNVGAVNLTVSGLPNTKDKNFAMGDQGTVRVTLEGVEYVWGPNESKTLPPHLAYAATQADSRLRVADSRDGFRGSAIFGKDDGPAE